VVGHAPRRPGRILRPLLLALGIVAALVGVYVGAAALLADQVPFNTTIGGVEVGGQSSGDAVSRLEAEFAGDAAEPFDVAVGAATTGTLDPAQAGLAIDPRRSVDEITGFSLDPTVMWRHITGAGRLPLAVDVDRTALATALADLAAEVDQPPIDGDVVISAGAVRTVTPAAGTRLDVDAAADVLQQAWLVQDPPIDLPSAAVPPRVDQAAVDAAVVEAEQAIAQDLTVVVGERSVVLPPQLFGDALDYSPDPDGTLVLSPDGAQLRSVVLARDPDVETAPVDATVVLRDGAPVVVPGSNGIGVDPTELADAVAAAVLGDRVAVLTSATVEPEFTTAEAEGLGIREIVSTFATPYPSSSARTENLRIATSTINGRIILPGEEFSLNEALGERTADKGYREAGVIINGRYSNDVGGGVSQVSTTVYNAAFFAGLDILEHKPHTFYISRYPEGREATLNWDPQVEMIFENTTDHGILVQSYLEGGQVHVTFWSTKVWDVEAITSERSNFRSPETVYDPAPDCEPQEPTAGFDVTVTRVWKQGGVEVDRESETTNYAAADKIICSASPG
jgi:vancomycin resistance protein YoaR